MVVSTLTLQATADILTKGVSCEVTNEHGSDKKSVPVSLKRGKFHTEPLRLASVTLPIKLDATYTEIF